MKFLPVPLLGQAVVNSDTTNLVINFVILVIVLVIAFWIIAKMQAPEPIGMILRLVIGILGLLWLLSLIGFLGSHRFLLYHGHFPPH